MGTKTMADSSEQTVVAAGVIEAKRNTQTCEQEER